MDDAVARARALIGVPFRLYGRDPATGLDCVGLVAAALGEDAVPSGYALRRGDAETVAAMLDARWRRSDAPLPGDVLLMRSGPGQLHLGLWTGAGMIHADGALGRVVERPGEPPWPVIGRWHGNGRGGWRRWC